MPQITTIIFDMYGTLVHNDPSLWITTLDEVCEHQGLPLTGQELWEQWRTIDPESRQKRTNLANPEKSPPFKTYEETWTNSFGKVLEKIGKGDPKAIAKRCVSETGCRKPFPETIRAITNLQTKGEFIFGMLSNSDNDSLNPLIETLNLNFDAVLSSESARMYKPDPRIFKQMLNFLGVKAENSLYVGDSQWDDVQGGKLVGMQVAWVNRKGSQLNPELPPADYILSDLSELFNVLENN
jgi:2-haloalkanoic acid dehalogenase type II